MSDDHKIDMSVAPTIGEHFSWTTATLPDGTKVLVDIGDHIDECVATGKPFWPVRGKIVEPLDQINAGRRPGVRKKDPKRWFVK